MIESKNLSDRVIGSEYVRCVVRNGKEVEWFASEKDAGAWIQHVYGISLAEARNQGIEIKGFSYRIPKAGDAFWTDNYYVCNVVDGVMQRASGVLCTIAGGMTACFAPSTFREDEHISCSGGPLPFVDLDSLKFSGLHKVRCWRWWNGVSGAGMGGEYTVTVPFWRWSGEKVGVDTN
jgi:hypothetical protein